MRFASLTKEVPQARTNGRTEDPHSHVDFLNLIIDIGEVDDQLGMCFTRFYNILEKLTTNVECVLLVSTILV